MYDCLCLFVLFCLSKVKKSKRCFDIEPDKKHEGSKEKLNDREQFHRMLELNREIERFKQNLENIRPQITELDDINSCYFNVKVEKRMLDKKVKLIEPQSSIDEMISSLSETEEDIRTESELINCKTSPCSQSGDVQPIQISCKSTPPKIIISDSDERKTANRLNPSETGSTKSNQKTDVHLLQPNNRMSCENLELVITPSFSFDIHETQSNLSMESSCENTARESKISLDQHMSILIRNLHIGNDNKGAIIINENFTCKSPTVEKSLEKDIIIDDLFCKPNKENFILLQKYFLRWVHYTTIEKLLRRNPDQTRLQKMQMFLQNITAERKKSLAKLKLTTKPNEPRKTGLQQIESPRLLLRKYNNK